MTAVSDSRVRQLVADCRGSADSIERPLKKIQQSSTREGPRWIGKRPFREANRSTVDDPELPVGLQQSGRSANHVTWRSSRAARRLPSTH